MKWLIVCQIELVEVLIRMHSRLDVFLKDSVVWKFVFSQSRQHSLNYSCQTSSTVSFPSPHPMHYQSPHTHPTILPLSTAQLFPIPHFNTFIFHHARLPTTPTRVRRPDPPLLEHIIRTSPRISTVCEIAATGDASWVLGGRLMVTIAVLSPSLLTYIEGCM
jgi:hypothetical protein